MNKAHTILRKLIIHVADIYVQDHDLTEEQIILLDDFADVLLQELDLITEKAKDSHEK